MTSQSALEELNRLLSEKSRRIFLGQASLDLRVTEGENCVYVLDLPANVPGAAGGRVGAIGERRIQKLSCFRLANGSWKKIYETEDDSKLERFELPYHASGLQVVLSDGTERIVSGVIDEEYIQKYNEVF